MLTRKEKLSGQQEKITLSDLERKLCKIHLQLHRRKIAGGYELFYYSYPSTYETRKNVVAIWKRGVAYT